MTIRRRRLISILFVAPFVVTLALPAVHVRLLGYARGEPFWNGWPASYWSREIADADKEFVPLYCATGLRSPFPAPTVRLKPKARALDAIWRWLATAIGRPSPNPSNEWPFGPCDPRALPILIALLDDPDPQVRYCAVQEIRLLGELGRPALPELRRLRDDHAFIVVRYSGYRETDKVEISEAVANPIAILERGY